MDRLVIQLSNRIFDTESDNLIVNENGIDVENTFIILIIGSF
jgi:hypothetical protein